MKTDFFIVKPFYEAITMGMYETCKYTVTVELFYYLYVMLVKRGNASVPKEIPLGTEADIKSHL